MTGGYSTSPKAYVASTTANSNTPDATQSPTITRLDNLLTQLLMVTDRLEANINIVSYTTGKLTGVFESHSPVKDQDSFDTSYLGKLSDQIVRLNNMTDRLLEISNVLQENV